jgi:hypothetical protein
MSEQPPHVPQPPQLLATNNSSLLENVVHTVPVARAVSVAVCPVPSVEPPRRVVPGACLERVLSLRHTPPSVPFSTVWCVGWSG